MKLNTIKTLKAERKVLTDMLSNAESKEAKEFINKELKSLDDRIESRIITKQWMIDMGLFTAGTVIGNILFNRWKK